MEEIKEDMRPDFMGWKTVREERDKKIFEDFLKAAAEDGYNINSFSIEISKKYKNCSRQNIRKIIEDQRILNEKQK